MKRIAVIGLGKMGLLHASLLNTMPEVELVAFCEKSSLIRRLSKNILAGATIVDSVDNLSGFDLDAVYVTTPPSSHHAILDRVFSQGICRNAFVEKPLANNITESRDLENLPARLGIDSVNMVGYNRRFSVTMRKAKEIIADGTLGEVVAFDVYALSSDFHPAGAGGKSSRGGVIRDLASHAIDLAIWCLGNIRLEKVVSSQVSGKGTIDSAVLVVVADGGLRGQIRTSWIEPEYRLPDIGLVVKGNKGLTLAANEDVLELRSDNGDRKRWYRQDLADTATFLLGGTEYLREDEAFIDALCSGRAVEPSFSAAAMVDALIYEVERRILSQG